MNLVLPQFGGRTGCTVYDWYSNDQFAALNHVEPYDFFSVKRIRDEAYSCYISPVICQSVTNNSYETAKTLLQSNVVFAKTWTSVKLCCIYGQTKIGFFFEDDADLFLFKLFGTFDK